MKQTRKERELVKLRAATQALKIDEKQRVVCAALQFPDGHLVLGIRHYSPDMRLALMAQEVDVNAHCIQGFVDQWGNFLSRREARKIAERQGQLRTHNLPGTDLFSEDLY